MNTFDTTGYNLCVSTITVFNKLRLDKCVYIHGVLQFRNKTISKEHISPELSTGHVELGLLFLQLAQVVILLIICCTKNGLQTMMKTFP